jgi:hypothetical protein
VAEVKSFESDAGSESVGSESQSELEKGETGH